MKTSLWVVVVVLTGIVGLLVGFSASGNGERRGAASPSARAGDGSAQLVEAVTQLRGEIARLREETSGRAPAGAPSTATRAEPAAQKPSPIVPAKAGTQPAGGYGAPAPPPPAPPGGRSSHPTAGY